MPRGRVDFPSPLGMCTRLTGGDRGLVAGDAQDALGALDVVAAHERDDAGLGALRLLDVDGDRLGLRLGGRGGLGGTGRETDGGDGEHGRCQLGGAIHVLSSSQGATGRPVAVSQAPGFASPPHGGFAFLDD